MDITWILFGLVLLVGGILTKRANTKHMRQLAKDLKEKK